MRITNKELRRKIRKLVLSEMKGTNISQISVGGGVPLQSAVSLGPNINIDENDTSLPPDEIARNQRITSGITGLSNYTSRTGQSLASVPRIILSHTIDKGLASDVAKSIGTGGSEGEAGERLTGEIPILLNSLFSGRQPAGGQQYYTNVNGDKFTQHKLSDADIRAGARPIPKRFIGLGSDSFPAVDIMYHGGSNGDGLNQFSLDGTKIVTPYLASAKFSGTATVSTSGNRNATIAPQAHSVGAGGTDRSQGEGILRAIAALVMAAILNGSLGSEATPSPLGTGTAETLAQSARIAINNAVLRFGTGDNFQTIYDFLGLAGITDIEVPGIDGYNICMVPHLPNVAAGSGATQVTATDVRDEPVLLAIFSAHDPADLMAPIRIATAAPGPGPLLRDYGEDTGYMPNIVGLPTSQVPQRGRRAARQQPALARTGVRNLLAIIQFGTQAELVQSGGSLGIQRERQPPIINLTQLYQDFDNIARSTNVLDGISTALYQEGNYNDNLSTITAMLTMPPGNITSQEDRAIRSGIIDNVVSRADEIPLIGNLSQLLQAAMGSVRSQDFTLKDFDHARGKIRDAIESYTETPTNKALDFNQLIKINSFTETIRALRATVAALSMVAKKVDEYTSAQGNLVQPSATYTLPLKVKKGAQKAAKKLGIGSNIAQQMLSMQNAQANRKELVAQLVNIHNHLIRFCVKLLDFGILSSRQIQNIRSATIDRYAAGIQQIPKTGGGNMSLDKNSGLINESLLLDGIFLINEESAKLLIEAFESINFGFESIQKSMEPLLELANLEIEAFLDPQGVIGNALSVEINNTIDAVTQEEVEQEEVEQKEVEVNKLKDLDPILQKTLDNIGKEKQSSYKIDPSMLSNMPAMQSTQMQLEESRIYENILKKILYTAKKRR